jgi:hypothetical protein
VPGISGAQGLVGPPLTQMGRRIYIASSLCSRGTSKGEDFAVCGRLHRDHASYCASSIYRN